MRLSSLSPRNPIPHRPHDSNDQRPPSPPSQDETDTQAANCDVTGNHKKPPSPSTILGALHNPAALSCILSCPSRNWCFLAVESLICPPAASRRPGPQSLSNPCC